MARFKALRGLGFCLLLAAGCHRSPAPRETPQTRGIVRPSILLVTLDTTRADSIGPEAAGVQTPAFNAIAARGRRFRQAYATVPETLPSHTSMMTGLYPGGHGVHENARYLAASVPVAAERLQQAGYRTAAFVSSFVLARRFGLARGFDVYDDTLGAENERSSRDTTDAALAEIARGSDKPRFLWVHYYDAHYPYEPPEPYRSRYAARPYLGEIAAMDEQLGRLVQAFERQAKGPVGIAIAADHGEGLGDHGEAQHGDLLYQSTMHVPLVLAGPGVDPGVSDTPVSTRRIFHTLMDWAGVDSAQSLRSADEAAADPVLGEAMKPFLEYGWQPQVMAVAGRYKTILAGSIDTYDVAADPGETRNLGSGVELPRGMRKALEDYPVPSPDVARAPDNLDADAKRRLASLGYVGATAAPAVRKGAPRPADMTPLLATLEKASALFAAGRYAEAIPILERVLAADPYNLDAVLRLATAHSSMGHEPQAIELFQRAAALSPKSQDVRTYLGLHYARTRDWARAVPLLEQVVAESPDRLTAVEALAALKARQGQLAMDAGQTSDAIAAFERARALQPGAFKNDLELGVLYLAARRYEDAKAALDRVPATDPGSPMALFKRAQVSVLLNEPDRLERIETARRKADGTTRPLIARERLFQR
jgi:arylsulfatase A-like enzyme/tetratricopeptide (TPR) repeat protein